MLSLSVLGHGIPSNALSNRSIWQRFIGCLFNLIKGSPVWRRGIEWSGKCKSPHANGEMPLSARKCHENPSNIFKQPSTQHSCLALQLHTKPTMSMSNLPGRLEVIIYRHCKDPARLLFNQEMLANLSDVYMWTSPKLRVASAQSKSALLTQHP